MNQSEKIIKQIEDLCRKADQSRSMHSMIKSRYENIKKSFSLFVVIGSAISAMMIFADIDPKYDTYIGIFLAVIFLASLIPDALDCNSEIIKRRMAVHYWGEWVRDAKKFCDNDISVGNVDILLTEQKELVEKYMKVMKETPLIPDKYFIKYKQKHLQKVAISRALDKNPFDSIRKIKRSLKNNNHNEF